jgi:hypothetical protein
MQGAGRCDFIAAGGPVLGALEWLAVLGHGGWEVVPTDICVRAEGWRCVGGAPLLFSSTVSWFRRRFSGGAGWLCCALPVSWCHCRDASCHLSSSGDAEVVGSLLAVACLRECLRQCLPRRKPSPALRRVVVVAALFGVVLPVGAPL